MSGKGTLYKIKFTKGLQDFYYVGHTKDYNRRMEQHVSGRGAHWILTCFSGAERADAVTTKVFEADEFIFAHETKLTLELMIEHGVNRVRGAEYCKKDDYTEEEMDNIVWACIHHLTAADPSRVRQGLFKGLKKSSAPEPNSGATKEPEAAHINFTFSDSSATGDSSNAKTNLFTFGAPPSTPTSATRREDYQDSNYTESGSRQGAFWTDEEESLLLSEIKEGKSMERIARNHNRSKGGITARLQMIACKMLENDSDIREIMEKTQLTESQIKYARDRKK